MAKAEKKVSAKKAVEVGFKPIDLSAEKRTELANEELVKFVTRMHEEYGLGFDVQLNYAKQGIVPRLIWIDVRKKDEEVAQ